VGYLLALLVANFVDFDLSRLPDFCSFVVEEAARENLSPSAREQAVTSCQARVTLDSSNQLWYRNNDSAIPNAATEMSIENKNLWMTSSC
jgi:hypothetical protein